ncbi:MAG: UDP-N-acetylmuramoyl-L-alanyl-D-glutamate--2,6-diaminopimelate ligase [Candidatus Manganitrophaceae bacterium]|nr:MAG: UDP-N-acetylmuramoyl-L-alanyl-D-glutamate--2,6-diaminopimelate ligase [Candidatus Manganitrophaceae bacterium]
MKLSEWLTLFSAVAISGKADLEIASIASDSREVTPGGLFVALAGAKQDGRQYISEAIRRGATAIVAEGASGGVGLKDRKADPPLVYIQVADARQALAHLASYFYGNPTDGLHLIGVTGTNGKTTTAFLAQALLRTAGFKTGLIGTVRFDLGDTLRTATHTTPGALELQSLFAEMRKAGTTHVVMEVSSHALDQGRVEGCWFDAAIFTNLTQDHLDYHGTLEAYFAAKRKLFDQTGMTLVNLDDSWGKRIRNEIPGRCWGYGIAERGDFYPKAMEIGPKGIEMTVASPLGEMEIRSPLVGRYNVYNLLAAIGAGAALGLSKESIVSGVAAMTGVPGRFEKIDAGQRFLVIVDYAHTEDALDRLLQAVADLHPSRIITVFGCGGDRDRGKRPKMGAVSARHSDVTLLTSDNPRSEPPLTIIQEIEAGLRSADASAHYEILPNRREAIERAIDLAEAGDAVVIAGKGHEDYQIIGAERLPFDDREVARAALERKHGRRAAGGVRGKG